MNELGEGEADQRAQAASRALRRFICAKAQAAGGALPFDRFMELALYAPGLGYYAGGSRKFGPEGDFVTAPEISPLFSRCMAAQVAEVLQLTGGDVLEFGAGSGVMAADMLAELERLGCLPDRYLILELSAELRDRQAHLLRERVPALAGRVHWLDDLPGPGFKGVVVANEVLDAFAVHRFRIAPDGVEILAVACEADGLTPKWVAAPADVRDAVERLAQAFSLDAGYESEVCPRIAPWLQLIGERLDRGAVFLVDYGYPRSEYYQPDRRRGTLATYYRHRTGDDVLARPGLQDITAHVDFTSVAEAAVDAGLIVAGYTTQARFLLGCGIEGLLAELGGPDNARWMSAVDQVRQLTLPTHMGERFQVMALTRGLDLPLRGFAGGDLRHRL